MSRVVVWCKENPALAVVLLFCILYAVGYLKAATEWLPYPNQIDYGEGLIIYIDKLWANGTWNWDITTPPYIPLMYGIGLPLIAMPFIQIFGVHLVIERSIMFASTIIICVVLYLIVTRVTGKKVYGIIAGLLPLTQPIIRDWSLVARVDMLAVMFSITGFYIALRFRNSRWMYLSIILFACAFFTKISALAGAGAVLIYLLIYNRQMFVRYAGILAGSIAGIFGLLQLITKGGYYYNVFFCNNTIDKVWNLPSLLTNISIVIFPLAIIFVIAATKTIRTFRNKNRSDLDTMIVLYFLVAMGLDCIIALRPGGFINYYLEFIIGACLCTSIALPAIIKRAQQDYMQKRKVMASGLLIMLMITGFCTISPKNAFPFPSIKYTEEAKIATQLIQDTNRPVITENSALVVNAGKDLYVEPFDFTNMAALGLIDDTNYVNDYREQYFDYIILRMPTCKRVDGDLHFKKEIIDIIKENYTLIYEPSENFYWYGLFVYESNNKIAQDGGTALWEDFEYVEYPNRDVSLYSFWPEFKQIGEKVFYK